MIVPCKKRLAACMFLCAQMVLCAPGAAADYTAGTPGGAGKVAIDPETGDRKVEVRPRPPAAHTQPQVPVYVYPQVGKPGPHPAPHGPKAPPGGPPSSPQPPRSK